MYAKERKVLGKKVKTLRRNGELPAHVFGKGVEGENVLVSARDFAKTFTSAGETGLIDLSIGQEKIRPVLIRDVQYDPIGGQPIHIDFFQVDLSQKVKVPVPLVLTGKEPESVHLGEAIILQTVNQVEVEALPTDLVEKIEVDTSKLLAIDDAITVGQLSYDKAKLTIHAPAEEIVVKLAPAVTAEMEKLLEEEAAETAAQVTEAAGVKEGEAPAEGEEAVPAEGEKLTEEEQAAEGQAEEGSEEK